MHTEFCRVDKVKRSDSLGVWSIYRVLADQTYRVHHQPEKKGMQVFVYTDFGQGILNCAEGTFVLEARNGMVFSADGPFSYWTVENQWHFWWFEFEGVCPCEKGTLYRVQEEQWFNSLGELALEGLRWGKTSPSVYLSCMLNMIKDVFVEEKCEQDIFSQAQAIIREKLYKSNVSSIAAELYVNPKTLYNAFRIYGGCSPKEYLRNYVIDLSKFLLVNTTKSICEIAEEMGFSNQFHFSRVFRETAGMSPSEYRKQQGK